MVAMPFTTEAGALISSSTFTVNLEESVSAGNTTTIRVKVSNILATNSTAWKQWLSDQYLAGTPVIIVYPLAEDETETVTGQTLQVKQGSNTIEITQASISGLTLEAKYYKEN